jgi:hypothetical protein
MFSIAVAQAVTNPEVHRVHHLACGIVPTELARALIYLVWPYRRNTMGSTSPDGGYYRSHACPLASKFFRRP